MNKYTYEYLLLPYVYLTFGAGCIMVSLVYHKTSHVLELF